MGRNHTWQPPGKDCGLCGSPSCEAFSLLLREGARVPADCPFAPDGRPKISPRLPGMERSAGPGLSLPSRKPTATAAPASGLREGRDSREGREALGDGEGRESREGRDVLGNPWDFVLTPLPGEPSARKIVLPFRPDLVERWDIKRDDILVGRPAGAGCPVQHVLQVVRAHVVTGVLETWVVSPQLARDREVKEIAAYHMLGFEGLARDTRIVPVFGARHTFLPGFCMMHLNHTGLVNMLLGKKTGLHVRLEDVRILAGPPR